MKCDKIKELIPIFLDKQLQAVEMKEVEDHVQACQDCQKEVELHQKVWNLIGNVEEIEPAPNYVSRFWTNVSVQSTFSEKMGAYFKGVFASRKLAPVLTLGCLLIIVGAFFFRSFDATKGDQQILASLNAEDVEIAENIELAENLEVIEELDLLEDLDLLANMQPWEA